MNVYPIKVNVSIPVKVVSLNFLLSAYCLQQLKTQKKMNPFWISLPLITNLLFYKFSVLIPATYSKFSCKLFFRGSVPFRSARQKTIPCISNAGKTQ